METNDMNIQVNGFEECLTILKDNLAYVEDASFAWKNVISILVIKLSNTDSINKANEASNATQIQLTSEKDASSGQRKTEDFFPTLTLNSTFKGWRIGVPVRLSKRNLDVLSADTTEFSSDWRKDQVQIRRRVLNADENGNGNPTLQICYGNDLMPLRKALGVDDYIVFVKRKDASLYEAFGVQKTIELGKGKKMYVSDKSDKDSTNFGLADIITPGGTNELFYGVPGAGKSYTIDKRVNGAAYERVVFHPDYTYSDFVGQIMPRLKDEESGEKKLTYEFVPGPFTKAMKKAVDNEEEMFYLVIEEINRGNAPAIFGDIFQLLDREDDGSGKYSITNFDIAREVYGDEEAEIRMPSNLTLLATMNTSDQNVFTLDTAFQRRWEMKYIPNDIDNAEHANEPIQGSDITWGRFANVINEEIVEYSAELGSTEDKQLGAYFAKTPDLAVFKFPEKTLKYLWDDAFKLNRDAIFEERVKSIGALIKTYMDEFNNGNDPLKAVLNSDVYKKMISRAAKEDGNNDVQTAEESDSVTEE